MKRARSQKVLHLVSGWPALKQIVLCVVLGFWQLVKVLLKIAWKGHRRKSTGCPPVELTVDSSVGTHCYIKILGVKYHYVETGPKHGDIILIIGDAPESNLHVAPWPQLVQSLAATHRVISLDLRGTGGSEGGGRLDLTPPRVVEELRLLLQTLGVSEARPCAVVGQGVGGLVAWYLVHSHEALVSRFVAADAAHPDAYWRHPPAPYCRDALHFIQWPCLPERWLSELGGPSRAKDWCGALNYLRGAAWYRVSGRVAAPTLLLHGAARALVASAARCRRPTLRAASVRDHPAAVCRFLVGETECARPESERGLVGRMLCAVAGRGRELSARLLPPPTLA